MLRHTVPLQTYTAKSVRERGRQFYIDPQGRSLPSVSTILNATRSPEQREALNRWRQRVGDAEAMQITATASRRGTGTHKQVQRYLQGEVVTCSSHIQPYWESIKSVLQAVDQVRLVEGTVFHYDLGYAGKADCVASYQGVPCLCEWKTADRPKSLEHLNDYPLQVAAYWGAVNYSYPEQVDLHHALLAIAIPDQPAQVFWFDRGAIEHYWEAWQQRVTTFWRRNGLR